MVECKAYWWYDVCRWPAGVRNRTRDDLIKYTQFILSYPVEWYVYILFFMRVLSCTWRCQSGLKRVVIQSICFKQKLHEICIAFRRFTKLLLIQETQVGCQYATLTHYSRFCWQNRFLTSDSNRRILSPAFSLYDRQKASCPC